MATYTYQPIDSSKFQFRLLTVNLDYQQAIGRKNVKPLSGSLSSHYLSISTLSRKERIFLSTRLPMYYALSYVWGNPTRTREILIDGKSLPITENLYQALRGMQRDIISSFKVWADAICINQEDLGERSGQILLMREIYHSSCEVRIWFGLASADIFRVIKFSDALTDASIIFPDEVEDEDDITDEILTRGILRPAEAIKQGLYRAARSLEDYLDIASPEARDDRAKLLLNPDEVSSLHQESIEGISKWRPSKGALRKVEGEGDFKDVAALIAEALLDNEWFSRMWVVQELGAATVAGLQIGPICINWNYMARVIYYLHFTRHIYFQQIRRVTGMEKIRLGWLKGDRQPLQDLIRECQYRRATDPRDKIYSLYGMMGDKMNRFLKPDYSSTIGEVFANATKHFISQSESIEILSTWQLLGRSTDPKWELPSWTPDYTLDQKRIASTLVPTDRRESIFNASGADYRSKFTLPEDESLENWRCLLVKGVVIDTIDNLSTSEDENQSFKDREKNWLSTVLSVLKPTPDEQRGLEKISKIVQNYHYYLNQEQKASEEKNPIESIESIDLFIDFIQNSPILSGYFHSLFCGRIAPRDRLQNKDIDSILNMNDLSSPTPGPYAYKTFEALGAGIGLRRLAVTKKGLIGAAPYIAAAGDLICVLYGCSVPVVLRPKVESGGGMIRSWEFVGECYLHGFMDAEAIAWQITGKLDEDSFVLV